MVKTGSIVRARWFCLTIGLTSILVGCGGGGSGGSFDGEKAAYGPKTSTTRMQSKVTVTNALLGSMSANQETAVVGQKTIGGVSYDRLATTRSDDPSKGGEYWIKENSDGTLDFAGYMNSDLLGGVVPGASTTFDNPIKLNLNPPVGQPQSLAASGTVAIGTSAPSPATFNGQYTLMEKEATVATEMGKISGCSHFQGSATSTSPEIPAVLKGSAPTADLYYHPSYGVVAFNSPTLNVGTAMTGTDDCGSIDSSNYRIIRKIGVVDASTSFDLDTYVCDGNQFAADKNTHAAMLLELRWVDETAAMGDVQPAPVVEFGTGWGIFPQAMKETPASVFHPEENTKGFKYWYSYVNQAAKNEPGDNSTSYHIKVTGGAGVAPVRVTARIYYKVLPDHLGVVADGGTLGGKRDGGSGADATASDGPSGTYGPIVLDPVVAGDLANWTPAAVNSNPTMTFEEIVSPYDSGVALRTTATGTTLMACPVEYTSRDFQLPGSVSSAAYALQLYLALDSDMTTYNWPGLQVDLLSGGAVVADIQYYRAAATGTFIMQRTASWHAIANNGFQTLPLSPLLDSSGAVIPTPVTFDKIRITMVNYTCIGTNSVIIDQLSLVPTDATGSSGNRDGGADVTVLGGGRDGAGLGGAAGLGGGGVGGAAGAAGTILDGGVPPSCGGATPCPTVIHSTISGGTWSDTSTWVEKLVPTATSDVEINGPVIIAAEAPCNNLTIKAGGSLQNVGRSAPYASTPTTVNGNLTIEAGGTLTNEPGWNSRIVVMGNCANGGTIKNSAAGVLLEVKKSFTQNGTYEGPSITFNGGTDQTISCGASKKIVGSIVVSNSAKSIKATSDMYLENVTVALSDTTSQGTFDMNGFKLFVTGGSAALVTDDTSNHVPRNKYTNVAGINCADGAIIYESSFANSSASMTIDGVLTTVGRSAGGTQVTFEGDLAVNAGATMQNEAGWHSGVVVTGSFVNNGIVNSLSGGYGFEVRKNLTQNNVYTATETTFNGSGVETISMGAGKKIAGTINLSNAKSGGTLKALSDLTVENVTFTVGDATTTAAIDMSQNKLILVGGYNALVCDDTSNHLPRVTFTNIAGITGASPDPATDPMIWESSFANASGTITLAGQFRTVGRVAGGTQVSFTGNTVLAAGAVWRNEAGYRSGISISGSFTDNGTAASDGGASLLVINGTAY